MPSNNTPPSSSILLVLICAVLTALLGAGVAFASLATAKVREVTVLPPAEQRVAGEVYFLRGGEAGGGAWALRRQELISGESGIYFFTEGDLNLWARADLPVDYRSNPDAEPIAVKVFGLTPSTPNFRLENDQLHISVIWEAPWGRPATKIFQQMSGNFVVVDGQINFVVTDGFIGKVPAMAVPGLSEWLLAQTINAWSYQTPVVGLIEAWGNVSDARLDNDRLRLEGR
jgi:hypothetical protein